MAAAILQLSNWYPDKPLIDPTCGSGTFCIEAAMIARNMAPGLRRSFAFEEWNWVSDRLIQEIRTEASKKINREIGLDIMGCDIDGRMVEIARQMLRQREYRMILYLSKCVCRTCVQLRLMVSSYPILHMENVYPMTLESLSSMLRWERYLRHLKPGVNLS